MINPKMHMLPIGMSASLKVCVLVLWLMSHPVAFRWLVVGAASYFALGLLLIGPDAVSYLHERYGVSRGEIRAMDGNALIVTTWLFLWPWVVGVHLLKKLLNHTVIDAIDSNLPKKPEVIEPDYSVEIEAVSETVRLYARQDSFTYVDLTCVGENGTISQFTLPMTRAELVAFGQKD